MGVGFRRMVNLISQSETLLDLFRNDTPLAGMSCHFAIPSVYTLLYLVNFVTWVLRTCFPVTPEHQSLFLSFWLYCSHVLIKCLYLVWSCYWYRLHATSACFHLSSKQANINYTLISGPKISVRYPTWTAFPQKPELLQ